MCTHKYVVYEWRIAFHKLLKKIQNTNLNQGVVIIFSHPRYVTNPSNAPPKGTSKGHAGRGAMQSGSPKRGCGRNSWVDISGCHVAKKQKHGVVDVVVVVVVVDFFFVFLLLFLVVVVVRFFFENNVKALTFPVDGFRNRVFLIS